MKRVGVRELVWRDGGRVSLLELIIRGESVGSVMEIGVEGDIGGWNILAALHRRLICKLLGTAIVASSPD